MSLKTDYYDGANGFNQKMSDVFAAGQQFVVDNQATLTSELQSAAAKGQKKFTVTLVTTFEPGNLRLNGTHQQTYFAGIMHQLGTEEIFEYEVSVELNTSDLTTTSVDLNFTF